MPAVTVNARDLFEQFAAMLDESDAPGEYGNPGSAAVAMDVDLAKNAGWLVDDETLLLTVETEDGNRVKYLVTVQEVM